MNDIAFIAAGWLGTAAALAVYAWRLHRRTRRAAVLVGTQDTRRRP